MSFRYHLSLAATLRTDVPEAVAAWLRSAVSGTPTAPGFPLPDLVDEDGIGDIAALLGSVDGPARLEDIGSGLVLWVQVRRHESSAMEVYGLPLLLAPFCIDGLLGTLITDMGEAWPDLFLVQGGTLFTTRRGERPRPVDPGGGATEWRYDWGPAFAEPVVDGLARYGASSPGPRATAAGVDDPVLARYLLHRAAARRVAAITPGWLVEEGRVAAGVVDPAVLVAAAAQAGEAAALAALDAGADDQALPTAPGWRVVEVDRPKGEATGRPLTRLASARIEFTGSELTAGPSSLVAGDRIRVTQPLALVAHGPLFTYDAGRGPVQTSHHLPLSVPVGATLVLAHVYERGHATCTVEDGTWTAWVDAAQLRPHHPPAPLADPAAYELHAVRPEDAGTRFIVLRRDGAKP